MLSPLIGIPLYVFLTVKCTFVSKMGPTNWNCNIFMTFLLLKPLKIQNQSCWFRSCYRLQFGKLLPKEVEVYQQGTQVLEQGTKLQTGHSSHLCAAFSFWPLIRSCSHALLWESTRGWLQKHQQTHTHQAKKMLRFDHLISPWAHTA